MDIGYACFSCKMVLYKGMGVDMGVVKEGIGYGLLTGIGIGIDVGIGGMEIGGIGIGNDITIIITSYYIA